jgi:hypothetical protein
LHRLNKSLPGLRYRCKCTSERSITTRAGFSRSLR